MQSISTERSKKRSCSNLGSSDIFLYFIPLTPSVRCRQQKCDLKTAFAIDSSFLAAWNVILLAKIQNVSGSQIASIPAYLGDSPSGKYFSNQFPPVEQISLLRPLIGAVAG